jgi:protein TonB
MKQFKRKHFLFIIALLFLSGISVNAQVTKTLADTLHADESDDVVFTKVDIDAQFPGGLASWGHYLMTNLDADVPVKNHAPTGRYKVIIRFIVSRDGSVSAVEPETNFGYGMEDEAIKQIRKGPHWTPAMQNGQAVNAYKRQPITFVVQ